MKVLVLNCGSSSLKFDLVDVAEEDPQTTSRLARGTVDRIGRGQPTVEFHAGNEKGHARPASVSDHREAVEQVFDWLRTTDGPSGKLSHGIGAVGHRVVHGGSRFLAPTVIDDQVIDVLEELSALAPLHNPPALQGIRTARELLGPSIPEVAVFDTAFHNQMPPHAAQYALPHDLAEKYGIRRYGFHGIAHADMLNRYCRISGAKPESATIITLQLGNGCSACAIKNGRSVDTSMGFTPLEGLVMGTRSGDIDPGIVSYLADKENVSADVVDRWLNEKSGLLGISGRSSDMRDLLSVIQDDSQARLAVDIFCYRVRKYIGAYMVVLGGAQAIALGGGIGEHAPAIRERIFEGMEWCGIALDPGLNARTTNSEGRISADESKTGVYVMSVDESLLIACYTAELIEPNR